MTTFEHTGFWWDAREPGTRWPGTLRFDPVSGAVLTRVIPNDPRLFFAEAKEYELLHGETTGGLRVTLLSAFERGHSEIYANAVILGFHAETVIPPITAAAVIEELRLVPPYEDKRKAVIGRCYAVPIYKDPASRGADFLFRSRDVETRLPSMFGGWLESAERLSVVRSLYFSGAYGKTFLELRLLAFAQGAEAYHRRIYKGQDLYMDAGVYEREVLPQLRSAIPKSVGSDHRQALNRRMEFGNEVSFGRRLRTLLKEHETALAAAVPDPCSWVQAIVDYRNGFTHHPVADEAVPDRDKIELIQCNYVLQILLGLCFLKAMTLEEYAIAALARKCDRYRKIRERFFGDDAAKK